MTKWHDNSMPLPIPIADISGSGLMQSELTQQILNLQDGDHLCLFYERDAIEQMPALVPFIQDGLSRDEQFIYIADDQTVDELADRLEQSGINVGKESDRGALKLWSRREWRQPGELSSKDKAVQVLNFINEASRAGFKGSRFAVEMTWALGPDISTEQLEHWEATLNTIFVPGFTGRIACQYNRSRLSPEVMLAAFHTHPLAILGEHVYPNWFYEAPLILKGEGASSVARLDWMISVLERARAAQKDREELIEKRAALLEAEASRKKMDDVLSVMPAAVYTCDERGRITFFNQGAAELWGRKPELNDSEEKFCGSFRLWRPDGSPLPHTETPMALAVRSGKPARNQEVIIERPTGTRVIASVSIDPLYDPDGRPCGAINVFQNITDLKRAEEARLRLVAIVESSDDAIISKDLSGIITSWNRGAERLFGYAAEEIIGKPVNTLIPPERYDEEPRILEQIRRGERIDHYETVRRRKDGGLIEISLTVSPIRDPEGRIIGASKIARDITARRQAEAALRQSKDELARANEELERRVQERTAELERANAALLRDMEEQKRLEEELRQAQKMESVGTLAGGIAHDFNNILNIIKGYAALIGRHPSAKDGIADGLKVIDETIERGASLVRQLLTLARKTEARLTLTDGNDLIRGLSNVLKQTFPKQISISMQLDTRLPAVIADPNQLSQVILNLCVNARDAMPAGGKLSLKTRLVDGRELQDAACRGTRYACIEVCDTGIGMNENVRNRVFEPFFTTKGIGEGTGLGLAIVYGIVKNHNGFVDVKSEVGQGTTFRVYLPMAPSEEKRTEGITAETPNADDGRHRATVLLVEDEVATVRLLKDALSQHGYRVMAAVDGEDALDVYRRHKQEIDFVLLDIGLPRLAGWNVAVKMKEENPDVNVIVASGYIEPEFRSKMYEAGVKAFISKPYMPDDIVQMLSDLDPPRSSISSVSS
jgi:PAS domain S-box-containing protein